MLPTATPHPYSPGDLVACRGRSWVVMPPEHHNVTLLRPAHGAEEDAVGIYARLEPDVIAAATYPLPPARHAGDFAGAALLGAALRLSLRAGAGPFRSVGRLTVAPRPYQYVPLAMALRLPDPVRMLIADDVGVGKTIEAALVARELLDRGVVKRIGVVCPPHLCTQWAAELRDKFGIAAAVVQSSSMARLERELPRPDLHTFAHYRHLVVSIDFIKSEHYRRSFVDNAPDLIIVDEAHTAARPRGDATGRQQQRYRLVRELADDPNRHIILATATPHSGVEESFRSLLGLLNHDFDRPIEQPGVPNRQLRPYLVQRRRADLANWLGEKTPFPAAENVERQYIMSPAYQTLYAEVLAFCRDLVSGATGQRRRVRYWAAVSILRCVLSSPDAARATLRNRAQRLATRLDRSNISVDADIDNDAAGEAEFAAQITDSSTDQDEPADYAPTAALSAAESGLTRQEIRRLDGFLQKAEQLRGPAVDAKVAECANLVAEMLDDGYCPIVYCRFIATAEYVADQLRQLLAGQYPDLSVRSVTGGDGNDEQRREIIGELIEHPVRTLVATDCLSEGINLQEHFDAVIHYDLPWNPNRLEQRAGRVDRYGQPSPVIKTALLWGANNAVDLKVLEVLLRKAQEIRKRLGVSVAAAVASDAVMHAVVNDIIAQGRGAAGGVQLELGGAADREVSAYHRELDAAAARETRQRAIFAQESISPAAIAGELRELEPALGSPAAIRRFVREGIQRVNGALDSTRTPGVFELHPGDLADDIRAGLPRAPAKSGAVFPLPVSFDGLPRPGVHGIVRNGPVVSALTQRILAQTLADVDDADDAIDDSNANANTSAAAGPFARCGAIYTDAVAIRTAVLILRIRYLLDEAGRQTYAEEIVTAAARRVDGQVEWLPLYQYDDGDDDDNDDDDGSKQRETGLALLSQAQPTANMPPEERSRQVEAMLDIITAAPDWWQPVVTQRQAAIAAAHDRLRGVIPGRPLTVNANPPDVMGCYVLVPRPR